MNLATVIRKSKASVASKAKPTEPKVCGTRTIPDNPKYTTDESEFKGYPILQLWAEGNTSRWADLQLGLKKCKVVLEILADPKLADSVKDFVKKHTVEDA